MRTDCHSPSNVQHPHSALTVMLELCLKRLWTPSLLPLHLSVYIRVPPGTKSLYSYDFKPVRLGLKLGLLRLGFRLPPFAPDASRDNWTSVGCLLEHSDNRATFISSMWENFYRDNWISVGCLRVTFISGLIRVAVPARLPSESNFPKGNAQSRRQAERALIAFVEATSLADRM